MYLSSNVRRNEIKTQTRLDVNTKNIYIFYLIVKKTKRKREKRKK